jgi:hypothetical protein
MWSLQRPPVQKHKQALSEVSESPDIAEAQHQDSWQAEADREVATVELSDLQVAAISIEFKSS